MERTDLYQDDLTEERQPSPAQRDDVARTTVLDADDGAEETENDAEDDDEEDVEEELDD
ncbi:MAG: hypothetical protein ABR591_06545 [Candidatus Velthaea sp.]